MKTNLVSITFTYNASGKGATVLFTRKVNASFNPKFQTVGRSYIYNNDLVHKLNMLTRGKRTEYYPTKIIIYL